MAGTKSWAEIRDDIKTAYAEISSGKVASYSIGGRTFTYHNLASMREELEYAEMKATEESGYGSTTVADFRRMGNV